MTDDGYIDESLDDLRASWRRGESGVTTGTKDLTPEASQAIDEKIKEWDAEPEISTFIASIGTITLVVNGNVLTPSPFRVAEPAVTLR